jgi:hypothetical protein
MGLSGASMMGAICRVTFLTGISQSLIDDLVQPVEVRHFNIWNAASFVRHDPDSGCVFDADPLAQRGVRFDRGGKFSLGVHNKGKSKAMLLGEFFGERAQVLFGFDAALIGKHGVTEVVANFFGIGIEPTRIHGCIEAPDVHLQGKIMPHPGNVIFFGRFHEHRILVGAHRALHIFKLHDSDASTRGWL